MKSMQVYGKVLTEIAEMEHELIAARVSGNKMLVFSINMKIWATAMKWYNRIFRLYQVILPRAGKPALEHLERNAVRFSRITQICVNRRAELEGQMR